MAIVVKFVKMEGLGNDFVVVGDDVEVNPELVRRLCDRRRGVGADGLLQVSLAVDLVVMGYWNADGSAAEMCGNGLRCVARYAVEHGLTGQEDFVVSTPVGNRNVRYGPHPTVELGVVDVDEPFEWEGRLFYPASVGNPHAVTLVGDVSLAPVSTVGPGLESAVVGGTNVEFVHVVNQQRLEMRVWERGVGETMACGSGMVAAAAITRHLGMTGEQVVVSVPGGEGTVEFSNGVGWLTGPARTVFSGELDSGS